MLETHKGPDVYIWNKISGEVVHHNEKLYLLIFSQKDAITRNLRSSVRFEKIGFGTIIPENNGKKINITLKDVSKTGFGIYVNSVDGINVNEEVYYEINIKEDNQIKQGKAKIVRICKDNNKDFIGLQVI